MSQIVETPARRYAGAVAHFILEAVHAARDAEDALMRDVSNVTPTSDGVEITIAGQRLHVSVRPCTPGFLPR